MHALPVGARYQAMTPLINTAAAQPLNLHGLHAAGTLILRSISSSSGTTVSRCQWLLLPELAAATVPEAFGYVTVAAMCADIADSAWGSRSIPEAKHGDDQ